MLQVCHHVAAVPVNYMTILAWLGVYKCLGQTKIVGGRDQGVYGGEVVQQVNVLIFWFNMLCYKYAILRLLCL